MLRVRQFNYQVDITQVSNAFLNKNLVRYHTVNGTPAEPRDFLDEKKILDFEQFSARLLGCSFSKFFCQSPSNQVLDDIFDGFVLKAELDEFGDFIFHNVVPTFHGKG